MMPNWIEETDASKTWVSWSYNMSNGRIVVQVEMNGGNDVKNVKVLK